MQGRGNKVAGWHQSLEHTDVCRVDCKAADCKSSHFKKDLFIILCI